MDRGPEIDLQDGLNEPQREAVMHGEGPLLILAGPGSGKTRVITRRIAWLVRERGVRPDEILAITFTNKAAKEMRERVAALLPAGEARGAWISTFHALGARVLRRDIELLGLGFTRDFSIYDTADKNGLVKELLKQAGDDTTRYKPAAVAVWISDAKNKAWREEGRRVGGQGFEVDLVDDGDEGDDGFEGELLQRILKRYDESLRAKNALDFDDLLLRTLELFERNPGARDAYARRFRFVLADEYQDTNRVQYLLTRHLASFHGNLAVCGDPDQSIYAWRGADIRNILAFEEDFGSPRVVKLEQNYRSLKTVLRAAQAVIARNTARKQKDLWSEREEGEKIDVVECGDENDEGAEIARRIQALVREGVDPAGIAIFYRVNFMQRALESQLSLARVPYQIVGGVEFYQRREVRDLVAYLRLIVNPADDVAFLRAVNTPTRGIGAKSLETLSGWALDRRLSLSDALRSSEIVERIRGRARAGLGAFAGLLEALAPLRTAPASQALETVIAEIDFERWLATLDDDAGVDRAGNVDELRAHAAEYDRLYPDGGLRGFLQDIALVSDVDGMQDAAGKVTLMTLHSAKGLEFPAVFIAGCEEELLPHVRAIMDEDGSGLGLEEERRLFYVGVTRAEERLCLTWAKRRLHFGQETWRQPSRFLEELPPELVNGLQDEDEETALGGYDPADDLPQLAVGDRVEHDHFGVGTVTRLLGSGINARATVDFIQVGSKQLLLQYAKLTVLPRGRS
jgi:DNA helicase-2/ATP-dependent DNA helicase PcrA